MAGEKGFRQPGIPAELADEVDAVIHRNPWLGYRNLSAFVQEAVRRHLRDTKRQVFEHESVEHRQQTGPSDED